MRKREKKGEHRSRQMNQQFTRARFKHNAMRAHSVVTKQQRGASLWEMKHFSHFDIFMLRTHSYTRIDC